MKKILFLSLLLVGLFIVYGCVPSEESLPGEEQVALAGQAISLGCRTYIRGITSCTANVDGSISVTSGSGTRARTSILVDKCSVRAVANDYSCIPGNAGSPSISYRSCRTQCESAEDCVNAQCISRCGNGVIDAGENCATCAADVVCAAGTSCQEGVCVAVEICNGADDDSDGIIDEGCDDDNDGFCDAQIGYVPLGEYVGTCSQIPMQRDFDDTNCCRATGDCNDIIRSIHPPLGDFSVSESWTQCYNNIDDDCDGVADEGCPESLCDNIDNDGNGQVDEDCDNDGDDYCNSRKTVTGPPYPAVCPNGGEDCADGPPFPDYQGSSYQQRDFLINPGVAENCFIAEDDNCNGVVNEGCGDPCDPPLQRNAYGVCISEICNDGIDNDADTSIDCFDGDCGPPPGVVYSDSDVCALRTEIPVCCLYHNNREALFIASYQTGMCEGAGRYPVLNEQICQSMVNLWGYTYR